MAYEYEWYEIEIVVKEDYLKLKRKARAFDAIVDIEDDFVKYHGFSPCVEEYVEEVEEIISEYMERADNEK